MRAKAKNDAVSVHAIAGTHVVLLGLDVPDTARKGLLGFSIWRKDAKTGAERPLFADRHFAFMDVDAQPGTLSAASDKCPVQTFQWADYAAKPATDYVYRVAPVYGTPKALKPGDAVSVAVRTEATDNGEHAVFFNRGAAGSQAYAKKFGALRRWYLAAENGRTTWQEFIRPGDDPSGDAWRWLSRGLEEAMLAFIAQATGPQHKIRGAVYEFTHRPVIDALVAAIERGVDVKLVHHAKPQTVRLLKGGKNAKGAVVNVTVKPGDPPVIFKNMAVVEETGPDTTGAAASHAVRAAGLKDRANAKALEKMLIPRRNTQISHNKFLVLLEGDKPAQVWTGSTNFTAGGIFGQSNVGQIVRDAGVAAEYLAYWTALSKDPKNKAQKGDKPEPGFANWTVARQPDLSGPPPTGVTAIFSPRATEGMLDWYGAMLAGAKQSAHMTSAFTIAKQIEGGVKAGPKDARYYLLLESNRAPFIKAPFARMAQDSRVGFAWGDELTPDVSDTEDKLESLTGLNDFVSYIHTKYMLIDALGDDPIVITGSANFSAASTTENDENMLVIRGDTRVADVFLGEFVRLFNHFKTRNRVNAQTQAERAAGRHLCETDAWTTPWFTEGAPECAERRLYA